MARGAEFGPSQGCVSPEWAVPARLARQITLQHPELRKLAVAGCAYDEVSRIVDCSPEVMRGAVERRLRSLGIPIALSLDAYTMARNIKSEAGSGTLSEKVGIGEALVNRAIATGKSFARIAMRDGSRFGSQRAENPAVSTRQDPSYEDIVVAQLVLARKTGFLVRGATQYFSPKSYGSADRSEVYETRVRNWGHPTIGLAWIGTVPGVNPWEQFFMVPVAKGSPIWHVQAGAGRKVLAAPPPVAPEPELCSAPTPTRGIALAVVGGLAFAGALVYAVPRLRG